MAVLSDFSRYLVTLRGNRTVAEVERATRLSHGSIARAERGERLLKYWTLYRLCAYYGADPRHAVRLMGEARYERDRAKGDGIEKRSDPARGVRGARHHA